MELESCQLKSEKLQLLISEQNNSIDKLSDDSKLEVQKIKDNQMRYNNEYLEEMNALNPTFNEVVPSDCNAAIKWGIDKAKEITNDNT
jgi:predicted transcriptional regulator